MTKTLFLPGAVGNAQFWNPVAAQVLGEHELLSWPGLGDEPAEPDINSLDDLVSLVSEKCTEPINLVAQSMGGVVAMKTALLHPDKIKKLVLVVTSAGVDMSDIQVDNWRSDYRAAFPNAARWIEDPVADLSQDIAQLTIPTLLIWGDADPISPVRVGERLLSLLPDARMEVIKGGDHDLAKLHSMQVAALIAAHLGLKIK